MANLNHKLTFNLRKPPPSPTTPSHHHQLGRPSLHQVHSDKHLRVLMCPNAASKLTMTTESPQSAICDIRREDGLVLQLNNFLNACTAYTQELKMLCNSGVQMARNLSTALKELPPAVGHPVSQEMAKQLVTMWDELSVVTGNAVNLVQQGVLSTLRKASIQIQNRQKCNDEEAFVASADAGKAKQILVACLFAVVQLQYQFCISCSESLDNVGHLKVCTESESNPSSATSEEGQNQFADTNPNLGSPSVQSKFGASINEMRGEIEADCHCRAGQLTNDGFSPPYNFASDECLQRRWSMEASRCENASNLPCVRRWSMPISSSNKAKALGGMQTNNCYSKGCCSPLSSSAGCSQQGCKSSQAFTSNEELQEVINFLSLHPRSPSSLSSQVPNEESETTNSCMLGVNLSYAKSVDLENINDQQQTQWSCRNGCEQQGWDDRHPDPNYIAQMQQMGKNTPLGFSSFPRTGQRHSEPGVQACYDHVQWPESGLQNHSSNDGSNGNFSTADASSFFMGLNLVDVDLVASARQRRHSSGTFPLNGWRLSNTSTALRTKSIENIFMDNFSRNIAGNPNQPSPSGPSSRAERNTVEPSLSSSADGSEWQVAAADAEMPRNCPSSEAPKRVRPKLERKYSLFGNS